MKLTITLLLFFTSTLLLAQDSQDKNLDKVQSIDTTLETLYSVISGEIGEARDWDLFKYLFKPDAKLIPTRKNEEGPIGVVYWSPQEYMDTAGKWLVENGFFEKEIHRETHTFGNITQVFSTYESFKTEKDTIPFARGINSIQLLNDGKRWWVVNIYWMSESNENPIPKQYLPKQ